MKEPWENCLRDLGIICNLPWNLHCIDYNFLCFRGLINRTKYERLHTNDINRSHNYRTELPIILQWLFVTILLRLNGNQLDVWFIEILAMQWCISTHAIETHWCCTMCSKAPMVFPGEVGWTLVRGPLESEKHGFQAWFCYLPDVWSLIIHQFLQISVSSFLMGQCQAHFVVLRIKRNDS